MVRKKPKLPDVFGGIKEAGVGFPSAPLFSQAPEWHPARTPVVPWHRSPMA